MWRIMIEQYFLVQDYALWEIIVCDDSFKLGTTTETIDGKPIVKQNTPVTSDEKLQKKNDLKAISLLLITIQRSNT